MPFMVTNPEKRGALLWHSHESGFFCLSQGGGRVRFAASVMEPRVTRRLRLGLRLGLRLRLVLRVLRVQDFKQR